MGRPDQVAHPFGVYGTMTSVGWGDGDGRDPWRTPVGGPSRRKLIYMAGDPLSAPARTGGVEQGERPRAPGRRPRE